jgi:superfamily II DNA or RNA helicase
MANVVDAVSASTPYYVNSTADPVKNDASEAFDVMSKLRPDKYTDRDAFMRKYGVDTEASREGLRREMARSFYTGQIDPGVKANRQTVNVDVSPEHGKIGDIDKAAAAARLARLQGRVDVNAMQVLSPSSFVGAPPAMHEEIAGSLQGNLGLVHNTAVQRAINNGAKTAALSKLAGERKGKPGVVFIHSLERVKQAAERLAAEGHRVATLTGADSSAEKDRKKRDFKNGKFDILIASDAGAVGANLQTGKWLVQYDTPMTAMLHAQRNGRIHRIGQTEDVELIDLVANHPAETRARERLQTKYGLREVMTSPLEGLDETGVAGYLSQARAGTLQAPQQAAPTEADREAEAAPPARQSAML